MFYTFNDIIALGAPDSSLDAVVTRNAARLGLKVTPDPEPDLLFFLRADQYSFVRHECLRSLSPKGKRLRIGRREEVYGAMGGDPLPRSVGRHESATELERRRRIHANRFTGAIRYRARSAASQAEAWGFFSGENFWAGK